jgi:type I restriction enzyme S subunit
MMKPAKKESSDSVESSDEFEVPEGWTLTKIRDLVTINYGKGLKEADRAGGNIPVYGSNGIVGFHNKALTNAPSIIIGRKGSIGEVHFSDKPAWPIDTTYYIEKFEDLDPIFFMFTLRMLRLSNLDTSTAVPGLNRDDIYNQIIPLPPLTEQQRIVARVEALLAHVNAARERLGRVPGIVKKFRQGVLAAACSGRLTEGWRESNVVENVKRSFQKEDADFDDETNSPLYIGSIPETWWWISVDNAMDKVIDYRGRTPPIVKEGVPHITTSNIRNGHINWITEKFVTQETYDNYMTRGIPEIGDVFFTMEGPLGEVAVLHENRKFSLAQRILLLRGFKKILDSEYLAFSLMSPGVQSAITMKATGSGVKGVAYKRFKYVQIPLPPLAEQREIVRRVDALFEQANQIELQVSGATKRAEALTQAILAKAFRGELVSS